jgi:hypothetical protein
MISEADYNDPLGIPGGFFTTPTYQNYIIDYDVHFMRYLYFMCIQNSEGGYPNNMDMEEIQNAFEENKGKNCGPKIKKILIGEAPPPTAQNYFYNTNNLRWNVHTQWTRAIKDALFPEDNFPNIVSFLIACAKHGFLLLDLFPYAITYSSRTSPRYRQACINAWGFGNQAYPHNIKVKLDYLICYISKEISFGFALKSFGEIIMTDDDSNRNFENWRHEQEINLLPQGLLNQIRINPIDYPGASNFLRVCGRQNLFGPCPELLISAGFRF